MKVFQINTVYGVGSTGRIVEQLKRMLEMEGHECYVAYGRGNTFDMNTYRIGKSIDMYFHALLTRITDRAGFYSKYNTKKLIRKIKKVNPDIIHLHNLHGYYLNIQILFDFLRQYNKPIVWTLHDCWSYTGHCAHYSAQGCGKWKTQCQKCPQIRSYPASLLIDNSRKNHSKKRALFSNIKNMTIITPSLWLRNEVKQSFFKEYDVRCIYNGIDLEIYKPTDGEFRKQYRLEDKRIILGVAGVWSQNKGINDFVLLAKKMPSNYKIVMVGLTPQQEKIMPENILCISKITSKEKLVEIYSMADVYFNASIEETMGLTTIEAMACGTPVVVYSKTAVPEVVTSGCGIVVEYGDIQLVVEAIKCQKKTARVSQACVEQAQKFSKDIKWMEYLDLYREMYGE